MNVVSQPSVFRCYVSFRGVHIRNKPALFHPFSPLTGANKLRVKFDCTVKILFSEDTVDGKHLKILYFKFRFKEMRKKHQSGFEWSHHGPMGGTKPYWVFQPTQTTHETPSFPLKEVKEGRNRLAAKGVFLWITALSDTFWDIEPWTPNFPCPPNKNPKKTFPS